MKKQYYYLALILIIGTLLRLYHNTAISLWHDEAFSALLIKYPWQEMMYRIGLDVHPPMYYVFLRLWHYVLGDSLSSLRGFSVFFGVATIVAAYGFVKTAFKDEKAALVAALLVALNPFQIQYTSEARMYTMGAFFGVAAAWSLICALQATDKLKQRESYLLFAFTSAIAILTHYYLLFTVAALCGFGLLYHIYYYRANIKQYYLLIASYVLLALLFLPWLKTFLFQYKQVGAGYWIPPMDRWSIPTTLWQIMIGWERDITQSTTKILVLALTLAVLLIIYSFIKRTQGSAKWLVVLAFLAPFGGSILFLLLSRLKGETASVYLVRYFIFASTFLTIIAAVWLSKLGWRIFAYFLLAVYAIANIGVFIHNWSNLKPAERPGMAAAAKFLVSNVAPTDKLYVGSSFEFFNLRYYLEQSGRTDLPQELLYSGGSTSVHDLPHYAGTAILDDADLLPDFNAGVTPGNTVWLLWTTGFGGSKPNVPQNWTQLDEKGYADIRPYVGTWVVVTEYKVN